MFKQAQRLKALHRESVWCFTALQSCPLLSSAAKCMLTGIRNVMFPRTTDGGQAIKKRKLIILAVEGKAGNNRTQWCEGTSLSPNNCLLHCILYYMLNVGYFFWSENKKSTVKNGSSVLYDANSDGYTIESITAWCCIILKLNTYWGWYLPNKMKIILNLWKNIFLFSSNRILSVTKQPEYG